MPIQAFDILQLIIGVILLTVPGYLWSYVFSKTITRLERIVFGFVFSLAGLTTLSFMLHYLIGLQVTLLNLWILYLIYTIPVIILFLLSLYTFGKKQVPRINLPLKKSKLLLMILSFSTLMAFLPHIINHYFLPFHVDEWIHWSYTRAVIETGAPAFINPYTGSGIIANPEIGFHISTAILNWFSGASFNTIFVFMPAIIGVFISLLAYNIGQRSSRHFGLEAAFLVAFIPTTARYLGPSFYVASTLGLLLLLFVVWLLQLEKIQGAIFIPAFIWALFIVHPVTALAGVLAVFLYCGFLLFEKKGKLALFTGLTTLIPLIAIYLLTTRWGFAIEMLTEAVAGKEYLLNLPQIWLDFTHLGLVTWGLFVLGIYYSFAKGKALARTLSVSAFCFVLVIGVYDQLGFGIPIIYERTFLYLMLVVTLVAGLGLAELRREISSRVKDYMEKRKEKHATTPPLSSKRRLHLDLTFHNKYLNQLSWRENTGILVPLVIVIMLLLTAVPAHANIEYYQMITEEEYEDFVWIRDHLDEYRNDTFLYERGAVHPFKASPFSAITGLNIVTSNMHPRLRIRLDGPMREFLSNQCQDTSFMDRYKISVIYNPLGCNNTNLTQIHEHVYLYPGLYE